MTRKQQLKSWLSLICLVVLTAAIAACGGGGSSQTTKVTASGTISAPTGVTGASAVAVTAPVGATVAIPATTSLLDGSGNPVTGTITTSVGYATSKADLPTAAATTAPTGATLAAFVDIVMSNSSQTVKTLSNPLAITINVTSSGAKPGDSLVVYSYDSTAGAWTFQGTELVDANGNISPTVSHFSIWGVFKSAATPPPVKPTGVQVSAGDGQATVTWSAVTGATSYNVYYGTAAGVTAATGTKLASATSPQVVTGLTNATGYFFVVTAVNAGGESVVSSEASATPVLAPPIKPAGIAATAGSGQVTVSWSASATATSYNVYYGTTAGVTTANGTKVAGATSPQLIGSLTNGTAYFFVVTAVNAGGESAVSSEKTATPATAPQVPTSPTGRVVTSTVAGQMNVTWTAVTGATSYNVYFLQSATVPTKTQVLAGPKQTSSVASATVTGLSSGSTYYVLITAVNAVGESGTQTNAQAITIL
jgi:fibronectin type 3 domain-containing protein